MTWRNRQLQRGEIILGMSIVMPFAVFVAFFDSIEGLHAGSIAASRPSLGLSGLRISAKQVHQKRRKPDRDDEG